MNTLIIAGRITADAVVRHTTTGKTISGFTVATDVGYGDNKHALFVRCSDWRKPAENLAPYLLKGSPVTVVGECDLSSYEKDGQTRTNLELNVREIALQGSKRTEPENAGSNTDPGFRDDDLTDIPF